MESKERYTAAIEISSSKIAAAVGRESEKGRLEVLAIEHQRCLECVRNGIIQNLEETSIRVRRVLETLQKRPELGGRRITGAYVGLSGRSVRSISVEVSLNLPEEREIDDETLTRLRELALKRGAGSGLDVIDALPRSFQVDKLETKSPKGTMGNSISAVYDIIVCRPELQRNLMRTLSEKLGIRIEGFIVTAMATGAIILSDDEKRLGCMLVDMGAETTTVSIYKDGHLHYFNTIPLGGRNITRDLTTLSMLEEKAEDMKTSSGSAIQTESAPKLMINGINLGDVNNMVVARAEEIVTNVIESIEYAGLKEKDLPAGIICIGGASMLNGMLELLQRKSSMSVRRGTLPGYITLSDTKAPVSDNLELISILYEGSEHNERECLELQRQELPVTGEPNKPERPAEPEPEKHHKQRRNFFKGIKDRVNDYFKNTGEDENDVFEDDSPHN